LELDEVSAVDSPANPLSLMALWKRATHQGEVQMNLEELTKRLEETESKVEELVKAEAAAVERAQKAEAELGAVEKALADAEIKVTKSDKGVAIEKAIDPEYIDIDGERVLKSSVPAPLLKRLESQDAAIRALTEQSARADLAKRAEELFPNLGGKPEEKAELVKMLDALSGDAKTALEKSLKAADAAVAKMFREVGEVAKADTDEKKELDAMVAKHAQDTGVSKAIAFAEVTKSGRGKELLLKTYTESAN
jgi:hypothetical protein